MKVSKLSKIDLGWRIFFFIACLWNLSAAIPGLFDTGSAIARFAGIQTTDYYTLFFNRGVWYAVLIFGVGYLLVALNPRRQTGIVILGILGKLIFAGTYIYLYAIEKGTVFALIVSLGDFLFTIVFIVFLINTSRRSV